MSGRTVLLDPEVQVAIETVLDYCLPDEEKDFMGKDPEDQEGHIYLSLKRIEEWLEAVTAGDE